ncbi:hypothetical protein [Algoriphagus confluentis]|uniref:TonB-dependent receptor plug domain-containing protein n=1 Tax=Algoriphagus confluentis TaxID=1697556 RepID=A0ABQ6PNC8_9BACT|nr:hypothetical protein Aconfl_13530 [Algoriphagus confluentis]
MKVLLFFSLVLGTSFGLWAQTGVVKGVVSTLESDQAIFQSQVFIPGTSYQSFTDSTGSFTLAGVPFGSWKLMVGKEGFLLKEIDVVVGYPEQSIFPIQILLETDLQTVPSQKIKFATHKRNLEAFRRMLVRGASSEEEIILVNPEVLEFIEKDKQTWVYAREMILIQNLESSYLISMWLRNPILLKSEWNSADIAIAYLEISPNSAEESKLQQEKRVALYEKSPVYKIRRLISEEPDQVTLSSTNTKGEFFFKIKNPGKINTGFDVGDTEILIRANGVPVNRDLVNAKNESFQNPLLFLPDDFNYEQTQTLAQLDPTVENLKESVFLHTDRDIYLIGDNLYFKAFMIFGNPLMVAESSKILHVEILDTLGNSKIHKIFSLKNGMAEGKINLGPELDTRDFVVKAYTLWGSNYGLGSEYVKPIQVLTANWQKDTDLSGTYGKGISAFTDKEIYQAQDSVKLNFMLNGVNGQVIGGNLSVSILKDDALILQNSELNSFVEFLKIERKSPAFDLERFKLDKEYGFILKGKVSDSTAFVDRSKLEVLVNGFLDRRELSTDLFGNFYLEKLQFEGKFSLAVKGRNFNGDQLKNIDITYVSSPNQVDFSKIHFPKTKMISNSLPYIDSLRREYMKMRAGEILLEEVVVDDVKENPLYRMPYGKPHKVLEMDGIYLSGDTRQFMYAFVNRVAGFRVAGNPPIILNRRGSSLGPPQILVNGSPITSTSGSTLVGYDSENQYKALSMINVFNIDRIEVIPTVVVALGEAGEFGAINIILKDGIQLAKENSHPFKEYDLWGLDNEKVDFEILASDISSTIFWNPSVKISPNQTSTSVQFKLPEDVEAFWVVVNGVNALGEPVSGRFHFNQKNVALDQ